MNIYSTLIRPLLFSALKTDPEWLHLRSLNSLNWLSTRQDNPMVKLVLSQLQTSYSWENQRLNQKLWGLDFANPVGLAAGFDKDGIAAEMWSVLGFGFAELGTVTCHPQLGNPRPRLFRLPQDFAALNRMGFNNQGSEGMSQRLLGIKGERQIPWGINLGKSKVTPLEEAAQDYLLSFQRLQNLGDYFVVNVSSPNTPGLRSLQDKNQLSLILDALCQANQTGKPILVKIAPDLEWEAIADVIDLAQTYQLAGIIATNTTIRRDGLQTQILPTTGNLIASEAGGISGLPVRDRSTEIIRFIWQQTQGQLPIIGVGGIFNAEDAWSKITAGASLIQVYTGWVYEGPGMVRQILEGLVQKLEAHGLNSLTEAVGMSNYSQI